MKTMKKKLKPKKLKISKDEMESLECALDCIRDCIVGDLKEGRSFLDPMIHIAFIANYFVFEDLKPVCNDCREKDQSK
jgi:hypothetical protein